MASTSSSFRATQWDPVLILSQIVCLQALWYLSASIIVYALFKSSGFDISLDVILNYREIRADNAQGLLLGFAWLLNSVIGIYLLLKIVSRARLVLDFSLTLLLYHVLMTAMYSDHLPTSFLWWALNGTTCGIMIFGGEYVCMQQEMEPILLGSGSSGQAGPSNNSNRNASSSTNTSGTGNNAGSGNNSNNNASNASGLQLSSQGAALATTRDGYGYDESVGLMMDVFDTHNTEHIPPATSSRSLPQKARSSEDTGVVRGGVSPAIRSSLLGNQSHGRQRTSDRYEVVPASDPDSR